MNNCLVTKLRETVENDDMLIYGVMKLKVSSAITESSYFHFYVEDDSEVTMTIESDDENDYFVQRSSGNKIGKTIVAVKNQTSDSGANAFMIHGSVGKTVVINDPHYKFKKISFNVRNFYQYGKSLEEDLKFREITRISDGLCPEMVCNIKKLIKNTTNKPYDISIYGNKNVVYDDIKVLAYCYPVSETSRDFDLLLHAFYNVTIGGKRDIMQIIAVRRYLGNNEGTIIFNRPENAYLGDTPLSSFGKFIYTKFTWTENTITVYLAGSNNEYSAVATINNSDKYDWE